MNANWDMFTRKPASELPRPEIKHQNSLGLLATSYFTVSVCQSANEPPHKSYNADVSASSMKHPSLLSTASLMPRLPSLPLIKTVTCRCEIRSVQENSTLSSCSSMLQSTVSSRIRGRQIVTWQNRCASIELVEVQWSVP